MSNNRGLVSEYLGHFAAELVVGAELDMDARDPPGVSGARTLFTAPEARLRERPIG